MTDILKNKKILIVAGIALLLIVALLFTVQAIGGNSDLAKQLSLGDKYLAALDYDNAILAFTQVLSIDPMNVRAYIGLSDAYIGKGDTAKAIETLQTGYDKTGDSGIMGKLDGLLRSQAEQDLSSQAATLPEESSQPEPTPTPTPSTNPNSSALSAYDFKDMTLGEITRLAGGEPKMYSEGYSGAAVISYDSYNGKFTFLFPIGDKNADNNWEVGNEDVVVGILVGEQVEIFPGLAHDGKTAADIMDFLGSDASYQYSADEMTGGWVLIADLDGAELWFNFKTEDGICTGSDIKFR